MAETKADRKKRQATERASRNSSPGTRLSDKSSDGSQKTTSSPSSSSDGSSSSNEPNFMTISGQQTYEKPPSNLRGTSTSSKVSQADKTRTQLTSNQISSSNSPTGYASSSSKSSSNEPNFMTISGQQTYEKPPSNKFGTAKARASLIITTLERVKRTTKPIIQSATIQSGYAYLKGGLPQLQKEAEAKQDAKRKTKQILSETQTQRSERIYRKENSLTDATPYIPGNEPAIKRLIGVQGELTKEGQATLIERGVAIGLSTPEGEVYQYDINSKNLPILREVGLTPIYSEGVNIEGTNKPLTLSNLNPDQYDVIAKKYSDDNYINDALSRKEQGTLSSQEAERIIQEGRILSSPEYAKQKAGLVNPRKIKGIVFNDIIPRGKEIISINNELIHDLSLYEDSLNRYQKGSTKARDIFEQNFYEKPIVQNSKLLKGFFFTPELVLVANQKLATKIYEKPTEAGIVAGGIVGGALIAHAFAPVIVGGQAFFGSTASQVVFTTGRLIQGHSLIQGTYGISDSFLEAGGNNDVRAILRNPNKNAEKFEQAGIIAESIKSKESGQILKFIGNYVPGSKLLGFGESNAYKQGVYNEAINQGYSEAEANVYKDFSGKQRISRASEGLGRALLIEKVSEYATLPLKGGQLALNGNALFLPKGTTEVIKYTAKRSPIYAITGLNEGYLQVQNYEDSIQAEPNYQNRISGALFGAITATSVGAVLDSSNIMGGVSKSDAELLGITQNKKARITNVGTQVLSYAVEPEEFLSDFGFRFIEGSTGAKYHGASLVSGITLSQSTTPDGKTTRLTPQFGKFKGQTYTIAESFSQNNQKKPSSKSNSVSESVEKSFKRGSFINSKDLLPSKRGVGTNSIVQVSDISKRLVSKDALIRSNSISRSDAITLSNNFAVSKTISNTELFSISPTNQGSSSSFSQAFSSSLSISTVNSRTNTITGGIPFFLLPGGDGQGNQGSGRGKFSKRDYSYISSFSAVALGITQNSKAFANVLELPGQKYYTPLGIRPIVVRKKSRAKPLAKRVAKSLSSRKKGRKLAKEKMGKKSRSVKAYLSQTTKLKSTNFKSFLNGL